MNGSTAHFDEAARDWDNEPRRVALMRAIGEAILREAKPTSDMDVLDYGCGTGLIGLFLLPHVHSVTGADNSPGMLKVLREKIAPANWRRWKRFNWILSMMRFRYSSTTWLLSAWPCTILPIRRKFCVLSMRC